MQNPEQPFPITSADRRKAVNVVMHIVLNGSHPDQIEAVRVLVEMQSMNQSCERHREPWMDSGSDDH